jgi:heptaprenyl diphosphate synthase
MTHNDLEFGLIRVVRLVVMMEFFQEIKDELEIVEQELQAVVQAPDLLMTQTSAHLLKAGGKRLRPAFSLLAGKCADFALEKILSLAVALELAHMATLVHDDVVDCALTRRGTHTVKAIWGNKISIHTGDYLFAKSLILISQYEDLLVSRVLADTSMRMCEGEICQIFTPFNIQQTAKDYFYTIYRKTALLIAASCQLGAYVCGAPKNIYESLRRYGCNIGMAFQITDDVLDMVADEELLGKPVGGDLRQGVITLPVIYALKHSPVREKLKEMVTRRDKDGYEVAEVIRLVQKCGGIDFSCQVAQEYVARARRELSALPDRAAKKVLVAVADFVGERKF